MSGKHSKVRNMLGIILHIFSSGSCFYSSRSRKLSEFILFLCFGNLIDSLPQRINRKIEVPCFRRSEVRYNLAFSFPSRCFEMYSSAVIKPLYLIGRHVLANPQLICYTILCHSEFYF